MQPVLNVPHLIAHRGASAYAPENTLISMHRAQAMGATWVEYDVRLTACGTVIVFHDELLSRTTNGEGVVVDTPYKQIQQLDAGSWFAREFLNERVPTFVDMLNCLAKLKLSMNIELKPTPGTEIMLVEKTLELLKNYWPINLSLPLISSFSELCLQTVKALAPELPVGLLLLQWRTGWDIIAQELACSSINVNSSIVTKEKVLKAKEIVPHVLSFVVDSRAEAERLFALGVDAVFSDFPDLLQ